ncbi:hypothetical protein [Ferribacterium limneticum]|uniref:hypothetical protein n=1 Tax=Ferribacterium limneticum TaxID=76259 RepID=UPI001CF90883|nr:hypothetical protein [Ferribacterium limneticum]UCV23594.1 hypothetical protein KI613_03375 [Ferribacterium limneticum]
MSDVTTSVPNDFPRPVISAVAGVQPKLAVRLVDGQYVAGMTDAELYERYAGCEDLAQQLADYCRRKEREHPEWSRTFNLERARRGVATKVDSGRWEFSSAELEWLMRRCAVLLGG